MDGEIKNIVWGFILNQNAQPNLLEIKSHLKDLGFNLSRSSLSRLIKQWRWSTVTQYTIGNLEYYVQFCEWLGFCDLKKLKFVDEVHFDPRGFFPSVSNFFVYIYTQL